MIGWLIIQSHIKHDSYSRMSALSNLSSYFLRIKAKQHINITNILQPKCCTLFLFLPSPCVYNKYIIYSTENCKSSLRFYILFYFICASTAPLVHWNRIISKLNKWVAPPILICLFISKRFKDFLYSFVKRYTSWVLFLNLREI